MKFLSIFFLTAILPLISRSQNMVVEYSMTFDKNQNLIEVIYTDSFSISANKTDVAEISPSDPFFIKDRVKQTAYFKEQFMNVSFHVKDSVNQMDWHLLEDTATILGYFCQSAKCIFRGREYIAFYTAQIPSSEGPWKFGGLPGLILSIRSVDGFIDWKALEIQLNSTKRLPVIRIDDEKYVAWNKFVLNYKETVNKFVKLAKSNGTLKPGTTAVIKVDSAELFYPELQSGKGITIEQ